MCALELVSINNLTLFFNIILIFWLSIVAFVQVSVGTLLAFTMVAISVLILRYVPPDEVPFPSSLQDTIDSVALQYDLNGQDINCETSEIDAGTSSTLPMLHKNNAAVDYPEIVQQEAQGNCKFLIDFMLSILIFLAYLDML